MSSTPEDGEVEQPAVEDESPVADLPDETLQEGVNGDDEAPDETGDYDVDTLPQLEPQSQQDSTGILDGHEETQDTASLLPAVQLAKREDVEESIDSSASIPDDLPSVQDSGLSSPKSDAQLAPPSISRKSSSASRRPFELRFQSRLSSSYLNSPRAASPAFLGPHSRHSSLASFAHESESGFEESQTPWEVIRWNRLRKLTGQAFSEVGCRNFGSPTSLAVTDQIVIGTTKGFILVFDHHQNNKAIIGPGTKAAEAGPITALAISADHTAIAAGHASGNIFTWEIVRPGRPFLQIPPIDAAISESRKADGHVAGSAVLHIGFLGYRRTALVSADDKGMAFSHLATRGTGALGRSVKTTRILGRYSDLIVRQSAKPVKKSSVLAFSPLPLGNMEQKVDGLGLVAMLTPYLLVVVSTTPIAQTQHKAPRPKEVVAHSAMTAALAWFPAIKLKGTEVDVSRNKLAYAWSNILTILEVVEIPKDVDAPEDKPVELQFPVKCKYSAEEAIVAIQWLSRSVIAVLTITQQLLIIEDVSMNVTDSFDLLPKNLYHADLYSHQLQAVIENHDEEDASMHGVVADAYYMSFRGYKGRLFLLGFNDLWWGTLTNWADRLLALMEAGNFIGAIRLATNYFSGAGEKVTVGLPEDDSLRSSLVRDKLLEMISASLRYAFGKNEQSDRSSVNRQQLVELAVACVAACLKMDDQDYLFDEVFEWYDENAAGDIFVDVLEPHILDRQIVSLPPPAVKTLINHFSQTHSPSSLEEIICLLDATAMDVDQVTSMCKQHNLYDAYIYVYNTALFDYKNPLLELLDMLNETPRMNGHGIAAQHNNFTSQKMFPYLSFILTGRVYPLGDFMDEERASIARTQVYETLFYGKANQTHSYAVLRRILEFDTPNFMAAMNEAFEDSFLNSGQDEDLDGTKPQKSRGSLFNRQIIVRILLEIMSSNFEKEDRVYLDMFIARNLPKYPQYMMMSGTTLEQVFTRLCQYDDESLRDEVQLSLEYLMTVYKPANIGMFIPMLEKVRFFRILKSIYRSEGDWNALLRVCLADPEDQRMTFDLILECLRSNSVLDQVRREEFIDAVKATAEDISKIDVERAAKTVDVVLPEEHSFFVAALEDETKMQFRYLRTILEPGEGAQISDQSTKNMLELYVRLMCRYDSQHVIDYISTIKESDLDLESVMPALETSGNIDAAVVLLAKQGSVNDALNRLLRHLAAIEAALSGVLESAADSPDEVATNEAIEDLLGSVDKYAKVGIWLCETQMRESVARTRASKSPRRSSTKQPLSFEEDLWLEFIVAIVAIAQRVGLTQKADGGEVDEVSLALRNSIQRVFTALLNNTAVARGQAEESDSLRFVRILRAFLSRAAETSPSLAHLRRVMSSIFSAYAYEESLLSLANAMLDKDLFVQVDEVTKLRQVGWRPRGQICGICRRRVWGPGTGLKVWESWEKQEKSRTKRKELHRKRSAASLSMGGEEDETVTGKGKSVASQAVGEDDD